jgi:predicted GIY-YIG superfamily endonuclease
MTLYKFYRIVSKTDIDGECYIGHTTQRLSKRFWTHCNRMNCSSNILIKKYGKENLQIILIHELEMKNREEACREERRLYEEANSKRVNIRRPLALEQEKKEEHSIYCKSWYDNNKEAIKDYAKQYYKNNKEKKKAYQRAYSLKKKSVSNR